MATGKVKWFSDAKGYGFIQADGGGTDGRDIFVHYTEISDNGLDGYRSLVPGQTVEFELLHTPKGLQATKVQLISSDGAGLPMGQDFRSRPVGDRKPS